MVPTGIEESSWVIVAFPAAAETLQNHIDVQVGLLRMSFPMSYVIAPSTNALKPVVPIGDAFSLLGNKLRALLPGLSTSLVLPLVSEAK